MKKILSVLLCAVLIIGCTFAAAGCSKQENQKSDIVLITDGGTITDGGYNQSAWEGITAFAADNAMSYKYYQPVLDNDKLTVDNVEKYVDLAAENGAQYIVFPGEEFAVSAYEIANSYPDVNFILLGANPHSADDDTDRFIKNVMSVSFDAVEAGFLAGCIAVLHGNTELGFLGEFGRGNSSQYGAGFAQGAAYAADKLGIPVTLDWADYDSPLLDYNYNFTITACYNKIADQKETTFTVHVVNGQGSGTYTEGSNVTITADPAPEGQVFDHWETKSDTDGVKDKKVNISSKSEASMNLLVEKCDCTITAVYKDIEGEYSTVSVMDAAGKNVVSLQNVAENGECWVQAPVAEDRMVFDHWETSAAENVEDINSAGTSVKNINADITLVPVYAVSDIPTFSVKVLTGEGGEGESTGSGSYVAGDKVTIAAATPKEGYMFSHWENVDAYGHSTDIAMENEYYWNTSFDMVDRYSAVCETMYNHGVTAIFAGGNTKADSVFTARWNYDYDLNVIAAGENTKDAYTTIVNNYGEAVKDCLAEFKGGAPVKAGCLTEALYATFVADVKDDNDESVDKEVNAKQKEIQAVYDEVFKGLADGTIKPIQVQEGAGYDFCKYFTEHKLSKCLTLNGMFLSEKAVEY